MTILGITTTEAEARLVRLVGQPSDEGFKLIRGWPWITGYSDTSGNATIQSLFTTLNAVTTYTNPQANGITYTGTFVLSENRGADESEDGRAARDCRIVQELSKVKTVTDVSSMGTPDKNADRTTMNFLGFQEGEKHRIFHKYSNLNPANRATAMGLSPTETGYTIVKREFFTEKDKTGTLHVVFEDDNWTLSDTNGIAWNDSRVRVGYQNYDNSDNTAGHGLGEVHQLTGLNKRVQDTAFHAAWVGDTNRVVTNVRRSERANGEYAVQQNQRISYQGTADSNALIVRIRSNTGSQTPALGRVWFRRTLAAKNTLTDTGGNARTSFSFEGGNYSSATTDITDHGDGTYTVSQNSIANDTTFSAGTTYFTDSTLIQKTFTRSKDNWVKKIFYWKFVSMKSSEKVARNYISGIPTATQGVVPGSDHVVRTAPFVYRATALRVAGDVATTPNSKAIQDWAAL